ncbi:MAG TPA: ABC transporter permease subunit [Candidatus Egerieimonas faecigallinarum]|nr:ABC transporter permease subunit [Candidatus Egerieimonas faecigallinarum]
MIVICKKELRSYFTSMMGYIFVFFILLVTGIYFTAYNINSAYPKLDYTLNAVLFVFLVAVPVLTMKILADERRLKTDQLLLTAPLKVEDIVLGKYLALITIYAIPILIICLYPLIMSQFGTVSMFEAYTVILGFFLLGCADIAIGVYISSVTESQVIAAVITFGVLFVSFVMEGIAQFFSTAAVTSLVCYMVLVVILALIIEMMFRSKTIAVAVGAAGEIILLILYAVNSTLFESGIQKFLSIFNLAGHFNNFANGILDLSGVLYFVSVIGVCMLLTVQSILKRRWN